MDMSSTVAPKSDQLNADDLISGPRTITISKVFATSGNPDQPVAISFEGDGGRPFLPCKTVRRVMIFAWGPDASAYVGRQMTLYRDPSVKFGGMEVGGIRISHMSHIDRDLVMALTETKAKRKPYTVKPLAAKPAEPAPAAGDTDREAVEAARAAARKGTERFRAWWAGASKQQRAAATPIMDKLRQSCADADAAMEADPFGLPPLDPDLEQKPDPDAMAEAERAAREAIEAQDMEAFR